MARLSVIKPDKDCRHLRRELLAHELDRLIKSTRNAPPIRALSGPDRAMPYLTSVYTGLRASELAALTAVSFDLDSDPPCVTITTGTDKSRKENFLPLRSEFAHGGVFSSLSVTIHGDTDTKKPTSIGDRKCHLKLAQDQVHRALKVGILTPIYSR